MTSSMFIALAGFVFVIFALVLLYIARKGSKS
jgi:hypothetical protein